MFACYFSVYRRGVRYKWGFKDRKLAGGYTEVSVPMFKNQSHEVSIEVAYTNALIEEFSRSQVADVVSDSLAPVKIEGVFERWNTSQKVSVLVGQTLSCPICRGVCSCDELSNLCHR
ncbi:MAG: LPS assembly lipoprotein LptE [Bdellovibrionales bacterium]